MLDRLPVSAQHLLVAVLPVLLGWATSDLVPYFEDKNPAASYLVGVVVTIVTAWVTTLTRQYGRGSSEPQP